MAVGSAAAAAAGVTEVGVVQSVTGAQQVQETEALGLQNRAPGTPPHSDQHRFPSTACLRAVPAPASPRLKLKNVFAIQPAVQETNRPL